MLGFLRNLHIVLHSRAATLPGLMWGQSIAFRRPPETA